MFSAGFPQNQQVTYSGMLWLLAAQIVVMIPLMFYLPLWILPVLIFSAAWRIRVMKGYGLQPGKIIKAIVGLLGLGALAISGIQAVSLDMMASILLLGFAYKALEVINRRDGMVVVFTGFILIGVLFLYTQTIFMTLYGIFALLVLTGAMFAIQQSQSYAILPNLRVAALMLALCLPLMIVLFLFVPRFGPLWTVPLPSSQAKTGITDKMTPGDIAELSQSDELAFRVSFSGERPKQKDLYWRGLVLQHFDGKTWQQFSEDIDADIVKEKLRTSQSGILKRTIEKGDATRYEVIYEKTAQPWLFALSPVVEIQGDAFFGSDFRIMANRDVNEPMMLNLTSYPEALREVDLSASARELALQLPEGENPQSRILSERLLASSASKQEYIQKVLDRYHQDQYFYTLRPPILSSRDSIDEFLIENKKGFCAHYAGSFVFMMRAAGIPARIVTGYQGGEWNAEGQFLSIHQFDAHAWTEVWLEGQGWVRFDPTSMVAPERIEQNLEAAVEQEGSFLEDNLLSLNRIPWLEDIRKKMDSAQYAWRRYVLAFDHSSQKALLEKIFGEFSIQKTALIVAGLFIGIMLLWVIFLGLFRKGESESIEHQLYRRFCAVLAGKGVKKSPSQTPNDFGKMASMCLPIYKNQIIEFTEIYESYCYNPSPDTSTQAIVNKMKSLLKKLKK